MGTDVFDRFLDGNDLRDVALGTDDDAAIQSRFQAAWFPGETESDLRAFLAQVRHPIAVRSSSLLEDSQYQPFSGVYETYMLPNDDPSLDVRLAQLVATIKRVYASTFSQRAKAYVGATPFRLEEEKMAIVLQRVVGSAHGDRFYPDFAGVARSHNFYPAEPLEAEDGIVAVALGLGRTVVEGGACVRFCPRYPNHQFASLADTLRDSQRGFWALRLAAGVSDAPYDARAEERFDLDVAEADGTLHAVASTYSRENDALYDGLSRPGTRIVTFAPMLKHDVFPLVDVVQALMDMGEWGMNAPVEIEFAVNLDASRSRAREFAFLQMRPLALSREWDELELESGTEGIVCRSGSVMGNGKVDTVRDLVVVAPDRFERGRSAEVAQHLAQLNADLRAEGVPYVLIGVGRWGSRDPWLGVPVTWDQISGARAIVEAGFRDIHVTPSQGSHFFQNIVSFNVGYFTVNPGQGDDFVDWDWLAAQPAVRDTPFVRHLRFDMPVVVKMNGRKNQGVVLKPLEGPASG